MATDINAALVASNQLREQFIKRGVDLGQAILKARSAKGVPPRVAVLKSGHLGLIYDKAAGQYRLAGLDHPSIVTDPTEGLIHRWNRQSLDHQVEIRPLLHALLDEAANVWVMLNDVEAGRRRLESQS